jgi:Nif-specific regulatory protein
LKSAPNRESGVGKERVAQAIHDHSSQADKPLVKVNCAFLPESLVESELFDLERGASTGATAARQRHFELAHEGTIFLDEIGDPPALVQNKMVPVIQEKEFERIGGNVTLKIDVRIIAATNRNLESLVEAGKFGEDLYYRLNTFPVVVPPLRQRKTDVWLLADYFIEKYAKGHGKNITRISNRATDRLMGYHWPVNVRALEICLERAVILSKDGVIHGYLLPPNLQQNEFQKGQAQGIPYRTMIRSREREMILEALKKSKGNVAKAARALGITERRTGLRVLKFGIDLVPFKKSNKKS